MFSLFLRCCLIVFILTISLGETAKSEKGKGNSLTNNSMAINKSFYSHDFKFLWFEAENAIDHSFYQLHAGISPELFAPPKIKEKANRLASNGFYFNIDIKEEPYHKEGYYIKYEVIIPTEGNYSFWVREFLLPQTSPVKWRFDEGEWKIIKDYKNVIDLQDSQEEKKAGIKWVNYGTVSLSTGKHILQLVIEKNQYSIYSKKIDAFVLAKAKFIPSGIFKPEHTIEMTNLLSEKTVNITLSPEKEMTNTFHKFSKGVEFMMQWFEKEVYPQKPELYKKVFKIMDDLDVPVTRYRPFLSRIFSLPDFSSSPQWDKIKDWFSNRGVKIRNNENILSYFKSLQKEEKKAVMKKFCQFVDEENITFKEPLKDNKYLESIDKYFVPLNSNKSKLVHCLDGIPQWLSSNPLHRRFLAFPPKDYSAYARLWELTVAYFTTKYPNIEYYWEVHNEPEVDEYLRCEKIDNPDTYREKKLKTYFRMYDAALEGALKANPKVKIGGPASCTNVKNDFIEPFIRYCGKENKKLDFISWHLYKEDPIILKNQIQKVQTLLDRYQFKNVELIVDEWAIGFPTIDGVDFNERKFSCRIVDSSINAAYAANCLQTMIDNGLNLSTYFSLRMSSGYGSGLIKENIHKSSPYTKKPIYYTFKMFNMLDNKRISLNIDSEQNIGALATKSDDGKQINLLIWNYDPFERIESRKIRINLPGVKNIKYDRYLIDTTHTFLGAEELERVEKDITSDKDIFLTLASNSVTLLKIKEIIYF